MNQPDAGERAAVDLRALYQLYGYRPYKVSQFEEYELYMRNKNFLTSEHVLAFSDTDGKLMALKPDITLSIVKNTRDADAPLKVCYGESVYRVPRGAQGFKEIMQVGVECIGTVDVYAMSEVLMLAAKSLAAISPRYALDVSDLGIISGILAEEAPDDAACAQLLALISEKNLHGLQEACEALDVKAETVHLLKALITVCGPLQGTLPQLEALGLPPACGEALCHLRAVGGMMQAYGVENVRLDFSVVNDMSYYNGLIFAGFVEGIPTSVLSGGRYDPLMRRMGRRSEAIGFAVYLDQLERLPQARAPWDVDALILYDDASDLTAVAKEAQAWAARGMSVRTQRETQARGRAQHVIDMRGGREQT